MKIKKIRLRVKRFYRDLTKMGVVVFLTPIIALIGSVGIYSSDLTTEDFKNYTPSVLSENFNEEIEYTGLDVNETEVVPEIAEMGNDLFPDIPKWDDVKDDVLFLPEDKQVFGTCYPTSQNYMEIGALKQLGVPFIGEYAFARDYAYVTRDYKNSIDAGTVGVYAQEKFKDGYPAVFTQQLNQSNKTGETYSEWKERVLEENKYTEDILVTPHYEKYSEGVSGTGLFLALNEARKENKKVVYRLSVRGDNNVSFYHRTVPKILDDEIKYTGYAHSMSEANPTYVFEFDGEPTIHLLQSTGSVNYHLLKLSVANRTIYKWEIYEVTESKGVVSSSKYDELKKVTLQWKDNNDNVLLLEKFLEEKGYQSNYIDGYYGYSTATALSNYLFNETGVRYSGYYWGSVSQSTL